MVNKRHTFHLVDPSPWPIITSGMLLGLTRGTAMYFHDYIGGLQILLISLIGVILSMCFWFRDIVRESTFQGNHTVNVQNGLRMGVLLFITSEVLFFFSFFWAFFHSRLVPTIEIGSVWPPLGILPLNPWEVPLLNTIILLTSGVTVTWAHHSIIRGQRRQRIQGLLLTVILGLFFTRLQYLEYVEAAFTIADSVYGSVFYMATGFHGLHVIIGTTLLIVSLIRVINYHFTREHHFGFEAAAWYWHFVDVVWLFLFVSIYWWGNA
jgi:cytochrome c oxidase subunit 3